MAAGGGHIGMGGTEGETKIPDIFVACCDTLPSPSVEKRLWLRRRHCFSSDAEIRISSPSAAFSLEQQLIKARKKRKSCYAS